MPMYQPFMDRYSWYQYFWKYLIKISASLAKYVFDSWAKIKKTIGIYKLKFFEHLKIELQFQYFAMISN